MISRDTLFTGPGGDTVQMVRTAEELQKLGVHVDIKLTSEIIDYHHYDLIHFFNIIRPAAILPHIERSEKPFVLSPIFVDYSEYDVNHRKDFIGKATKILGREGAEYIKSLARWIKNGEKIDSRYFLIHGQKKSINRILASTKVLLPNSLSELHRIKHAFDYSGIFEVVPNGADFEINGTEQNSEDRKGVLCVGRIESYKNQLSIIRALKDTGIKLTIIGKPAPNHIPYYQQCIKEAGENVVFIDHLERKELYDYYRSHRVHVSASWFETTGLCNLEAALNNCTLVITKKGDTSDYFQNDVLYCDPNDTDSIKSGIIEALATPPSSALKNRIIEEYSWPKAAEKTLKAYNIAIQNG